MYTYMHASIQKAISEVSENAADIGYFCTVHKGMGVGKIPVHFYYDPYIYIKQETSNRRDVRVALPQ